MSIFFHAPQKDMLTESMGPVRECVQVGSHVDDAAIGYSKIACPDRMLLSHIVYCVRVWQPHEVFVACDPCSDRIVLYYIILYCIVLYCIG